VSMSATLYIVATPIGNLADMSQRAIETLKGVDLIAAEDTRHSRVLFNQFGIQTPCCALHDHNEGQVVAGLIDRLHSGEAMALISDAGTPLISDPGYRLVAAAHQAGIKVVPIPGPSALITALSASGLASDRFTFEGFLPARASARRQVLEQLKTDPRTLIFYESPHRILASLEDMRAIFGGDRRSALARELTKLFETILSTTLDGLCQQLQQDANQQRGEMVVMLAGAEQQHQDGVAVDDVLRPLLADLPLRQAVALTVKITGLGKNQVYQRALALSENG